MSHVKPNLPASVRQRLKNRADCLQLPFQELAQRYAIERFLARLDASVYANRFVLKGAQLLRVWGGPASRPTMDIDFLGRIDNDPGAMCDLFQEVCRIPPPVADGMEFDPETVRAIRIKEDADYHGVRVSFLAKLDTIRLPMQIDIGFNDIITPDEEIINFPTLLDMPPPRLSAYNRETLIAEKVEAMVKLGVLNSRMKDFYDIWALSHTFHFEANQLGAAIQATFHHRDTAIPTDLPVLLRPSETDLVQKQVQWAAFCRKSRVPNAPTSFKELAAQLTVFLKPILRRDTFATSWSPPGPWQ